MRQMVDDTLIDRTMVLRIAATFGALALVLATVGVAGVMSYLMARRAREIGIRVAVGASPRAIVTLVLRQGLTMAAIGVGMGVVGWLIVMPIISRWLYRVSPMDPSTLTVVGLTLAAAAIVAMSMPLRRCLRVDPLDILRPE